MYRDTSTEAAHHPGPAPHEQHVEQHVDVRLPDGDVVRLRPLRPGEVEVLMQVFTGMSDRSRRQRFLVPMPRLPGSARRALTDLDGRDRVAWVALAEGVPVGLARYSRTGNGRAEIAFEVVDDHQRRGIGSALVDAVATVAAHHGIHVLEASVDPDNRASVRLLGRLGIRLRPVDGLLEGEGLICLPEPSALDRHAVMTLVRQEAATTASSAAAISSSRRSEPCGATS